MKAKLISITFFFIYLNINAQDQYFNMGNKIPLIHNPALTGINDYAQLNIFHQNMAPSLSNGSKVSILSFNTSIKKTSSGIGGYIRYNSDNVSNSNDLGLSYAFQSHITRKLKFSIGTVFEKKQIVQFDFSSFYADTALIPRPSLFASKTNHFNLNFGGLVYSENLFIGIVVKNSILNEIPAFLMSTIGYQLHTVRHDYITIIPQLLFTYQDNFTNLTTKLDINIKLIHLAASYNFNNAFSVFVGADVKQYSINYAYSTNNNILGNSKFSTHEFSVQYKIINTKYRRNNHTAYSFKLF